MPERWTVELRRVEHLHPDEDLVERARRRPTRPPLPPARSTRIVTILVALVLPLALIYGAFSMMRERGITPGNAGSGEAIPTNGDLLYAKRVNNGWSLFMLDPMTGIERQITQGYRDYGSDWSPDGTKIVYDSETADEAKGIWVANADGSDATKLIDDGRVPAWSPDGSTIAFARPDLSKTVWFGDGSGGTPFYLYLMDADGTNVRRLTDGDLSDYSPVWSPDGSQIAFLRTSSEASGLFVMNADGSNQRALATGLEIFGAPSWAPDGTAIAIAMNGTQGGRQGGIMLISADGTGSPTMIPGTQASYPDYVSNPAWSPDGEWIAYIEGYPGRFVLIHPDGSGRRVLEVDPGSDSIEEIAWGSAPPGALPSSSP
jgi:Tol biopolymer transport system component